MAKIFSDFYDIPVDPYAATVDSVSEYYHVQSVSKGGTYLDVVASTSLNYPVNTGTRLFVFLPQRIDRSDLTGSRPITITDETIASNLSRVTGVPTGNEYRIPPESSVRRDAIEISSTKIGNTISFDYYGIGSVLNAYEYNKRHWVNNYSITSNYIIDDNDYYNCIDVAHSSTTTKITVTLPTVAQNTGRLIRIQNTGSGLTLIDGEGAEKISFLGNSLDDVKLLMDDDYVELRSNGTKWICEHASINKITNWINTADETNRHFGSAFTYDTKSAATDWTGKHITEATSNQTAIVLYDSGGTGNTGILYVYNIAVGTGIWTHNRVVTAGDDAATVAVEESSGSSKNIDYNFYHGFGINEKDIKVYGFWSTNATWNNSRKLEIGLQNTAANYGITLYQNSTNDYIVQTGDAGIAHLSTSGVATGITTSDEYYCLKASINF